MKKRLADFIFSNDSFAVRNINESTLDLRNWRRLAGINESQDLFAGKDLNDRAVSDFEIALEGAVEDLRNAGCHNNPRVNELISMLEDKIEKFKTGIGPTGTEIAVVSLQLGRVIKACPELQGSEKFRIRSEIGNRITQAGKKFEEDVYASRKLRPFMYT